MTRLLHNVFALVLTLVSATAFAGAVSAKGRAVLNSCGYYSTQNAEVTLRYRNDWVSAGSKVYLLYGWGEYVSGTTNIRTDWQYYKELEVPETLDPVTGYRTYTWNVTVTGIIGARSSSTYFGHFDFVWKVVYPDGAGEYYEKGNSSTYGYYAANFSQLERPCTSDGNFIGTPTSLPITSVVKW